MSILARFKDIMSSNVNASFVGGGDPVKLADKLMRQINDDLGKVKAETAGVEQVEFRARRALDECGTEIEKMQSYAERAVGEGRDEEARLFLQKKKQQTERRVQLQADYERAALNAGNMHALHNKLDEQARELQARREAALDKMNQAKGGAGQSPSYNTAAFDQMEEHANRMLDEATALAALNESAVDRATDLAQKYEEIPLVSEPEIDDELAAMKRKLTSERSGD